MKVVFLDFDGVLNRLSDIAFGAGESAFNVDAIKRLNDIVHEAKAKVVVSSSWRVNYSLDELRKLLAEVGFRGEIIGCTPIYSNEEAHSLPDIGLIRCREIQAWIDKHPEPLTSFVVLDDLELSLLAAYQIKTDMEEGLLDEHIGMALAILG
jgi:hypothetical protein